MLLEDFEDELVDWMSSALGEDVLDVWGPPDTALNPMASSTRQLVTPGLYGRRPTVTAPPGGDALTGTNGYMDRARMWSRAQRLQYLVVGAGIWLRRVAVSRVGDEASLVDWLVNPADVVVFVDESNPQAIVEIWHLRQRTAKLREGGTESFYAWDVWRLLPDGSGSLSVHRAEHDGSLGADVSDVFLTLTGEGESYRGVLSGKRYPWLTPEGKAYLPWVVYRAEESEEFWPVWRRGAHRGTLRACAHWTYTSRSALFATGEHVIITGPDPGALPTEHRLSQTGTTGVSELQQQPSPQTTMRFHPGTMTVLPMEAGKTLQSIKIGPGVNLPLLSDFSAQYQMALAIGDGLHPSDATRQSANPTSGVALEIQASSRREFSAQVLPLFRDADLELITKCAWLLASAGVDVPALGYSIEYHTIPLSPTEQEDLRSELEWEETHGQISPVDLHLRLHPGKTREQALAAIVNARADAAEIDQLVDAELVRRGVKPAPKPPPPMLLPPPVEDDDEDDDPPL